MDRWSESEDSVLLENPDFDSAFEFSNFGFVTVLIPQGNPLYGQGEFPVEVGALAFWVTLPLPDERDPERRFADFLPVERVLIDGHVAGRLFEPPNSPFRQWLLDGAQVRELWQQLYAGGQFEIQGEKLDESSHSFAVGTPPAADFRLRADQFDTCVASMTRDLEMHQLLLEEDEEP
jgi:hypothetical protein